MLPRRHLLLGPLAVRLVVPVLALAGTRAAAQSRAALASRDPLRLGIDRALVDSGLAPALLRGFASDTGLPVKPIPGAAAPLLLALAHGELDAALTNAPDAEGRLEQQGLAFDRHAIAAGEFVIVGPALRGGGEDALGSPLAHDAAAALKRLANAGFAQARPPQAGSGAADPAQPASGTVVFLSAGDGSGAHLAEQALWRAAGVAPAAPWYVTLPPGADLLAEARARGAFAVVERGAWQAARAGASLAVRVDGDPRQAEIVHVLRGFHADHPAGKIFVAWIASAKGRRVAQAHGYRASA